MLGSLRKYLTLVTLESLDIHTHTTKFSNQGPGSGHLKTFLVKYSTSCERSRKDL